MNPVSLTEPCVLQSKCKGTKYTRSDHWRATNVAGAHADRKVVHFQRVQLCFHAIVEVPDRGALDPMKKNEIDFGVSFPLFPYQFQDVPISSNL